MSLLKSYAKQVELVGSVAVDLIVKKDIDIHVLVPPGHNPLHVATQVVERLLEKTELDIIRVSYYKDLESVNCAIDSYPGPSGNWSFDVWITADLQKTGFDLAHMMRTALIDEQRQLIMEIKQHLHERGLLKNGMSRIVYDAVMDNEVRSLQEFLQLNKT